jgi:hypothetical protein
MFTAADHYWIALKSLDMPFREKEKDLKAAAQELEYFTQHRLRAVQVGKKLRALSEKALQDAQKDVANAKNILAALESEKDQKVANDFVGQIEGLSKKVGESLKARKGDFDKNFASDKDIMAVRGNPKHDTIKVDLEKAVTFQQAMIETDAVNKAHDQHAAAASELEALAEEAKDVAGAATRNNEEWKKAALDLAKACGNAATLVKNSSEVIDGKGKQSEERYGPMLREPDAAKLGANKKILGSLKKEIEKQWASYEATLVGFKAQAKRADRIPADVHGVAEVASAAAQIAQLVSDVAGYAKTATEAKVKIDKVMSQVS